MTDSADRNFDELAQRFARRVYGGLKGEIRLAVLWADLQPALAELSQRRGDSLRVLDVGGGLGQLAVRLAERGHDVVYNDLSPVMLEQARHRARTCGVELAIEWICAPYQSLLQAPIGSLPQGGDPMPGFDLILCHALLEWLEEPELLVPALASLLRPGGYLSLCFYNPAAKTYRNLIRGNFDWLNQEQAYRSDAGSLTPNNPSSLQQVREWLRQSQLEVTSESGLRVFHDYVVEKRGGHQSPEQVLEMELRYSREEPFKWLGRYLHLMARRALD